MQAANTSIDYASVSKETIFISPWQCVPYVNVRDICCQGSEFEQLKQSIISHGLMTAMGCVHVVCLPLRKYVEENVEALMAPNYIAKLNKAEQIYGIVDGAHRVAVVQEFVEVIDTIND